MKYTDYRMYYLQDLWVILCFDAAVDFSLNNHSYTDLSKQVSHLAHMLQQSYSCPDMKCHSLGRTHSAATLIKACVTFRSSKHQLEIPSQPTTLSTLQVFKACVTLNVTAQSYDPLPSCGILKIPKEYVFSEADGHRPDKRATGRGIYFLYPIFSEFINSGTRSKEKGWKIIVVENKKILNDSL